MCSIVSAAALFYASFVSAVPLLDLFGVLAIVVFAVCYSAVLANGNFLLCLLPPAVSAAAVFADAGYNGSVTLVFFLQCTDILFMMLIAVCINACAVKKIGGCTAFVWLTALTSLFAAVTLLFFVYDIYGNIGLETVKGAIEDLADFFGNAVRASYQAMQSGLGSSAVGDAVSASSESLAVSMENSIRVNLPSVVIMYGMFVSALCMIFYKYAVKFAGLEEICLYNRNYRFTVSKTSAVIFEIQILVYIIAVLFFDNFAVKAAFSNLISVLTLPFAYIGLRALTYFIANKISSKAAAKAIVIATSAALAMFFGSSLLMFAALGGASFTARTKYADGDK